MGELGVEGPEAEAEARRRKGTWEGAKVGGKGAPDFKYFAAPPV